MGGESDRTSWGLEGRSKKLSMVGAIVDFSATHVSNLLGNEELVGNG